MASWKKKQYFKGMLFKRASLVVLCAALATPFAVAQEDVEPAQEEVEEDETSVLGAITVTAQKREQNIQDVGIAITAFSGDQLEKLGLESSVDLINFTPNVSLAGDIGGQRAIFNIRGVVQNDFADSAEAPVAVYVDGAYLASTQAQTFGLFDIDRVEILKGPQGTLFGRNATGGLVNTITAKPTDEFDAYLETTFARFSQVRVEGAVGGAITDGIRGRVSVLSNTQGEILENISDGLDANGVTGTPNGGDDVNNDDTQAIRAQLEFDAGSNGTILFAGNFADTVTSSSPYQQVTTTEVFDSEGRIVDVIFAADDPLGCVTLTTEGTCLNGETRPVQGGDFFGNAGDPDGSGDLVDRDFAFDDQNRIRSWGFSGTVDYDLGFADFVSITDYKEFERAVAIDSDQSPTPAAIFQSDGDIEQFSQELRLSGNTERLNWVTGFYYLGINTDHVQGLAGNPNSPPEVLLQGIEINTSSQLETDSFSVFAQGDYQLTDALTIIAGARIIQENKSLVGEAAGFLNLDDRVIETDGAVLFPTDSFDGDNDDTLWSGKIQLEYSPSADSLYYVGVNRGVKAGGFNTPLIAGFSPYDREILLSYEAGAKKSFLNGRARINASVFYYDYDDYQSFSFVNQASVVTNEQARFVGGEFELFLNPVPGLDIVWSASYIDAEVQDLQIAAPTSDDGEGVFADVPPPFTPEFQTSGFVRYGFDFLDGELAGQISASYQTETFNNARAFTAHNLGDRFQSDLQVSWTDNDNKWSIIGFIDNVSDSEDAIIGFDVTGFFGSSQIAFLKPRTFGATIRRNF